MSSTKVNQLFTLAALVSPSFSVTVTCTRPAPSVGSCGEVKERPGGIVAVIVVGLVTVNDPEESSASPTWMFATTGLPFCSNFVPVIVTPVDVEVKPMEGLRLVTVGRVLAEAWLQR